MATMTGEWSLLFAKVSHSTGQALGAESISSAIAVDLKAYTYSSWVGRSCHYLKRAVRGAMRVQMFSIRIFAKSQE